LTERLPLLQTSFSYKEEIMIAKLVIVGVLLSLTQFDLVLTEETESLLIMGKLKFNLN